MLHLVGDLFELYDDVRTYKPSILLLIMYACSNCSAEL